MLKIEDESNDKGGNIQAHWEVITMITRQFGGLSHRHSTEEKWPGMGNICKEEITGLANVLQMGGIHQL